MPEKVALTDYIKPGQIYDANLQCTLMHGPGFNQVGIIKSHNLD
jgi:hypothetical protein